MANLPSHSMNSGYFSQKGKAARREANLLAASGAEFRNEWSYKVDNFTFSNSDKTRGCKEILTVEGPASSYYICDRRDCVYCSI